MTRLPYTTAMPTTWTAERVATLRRALGENTEAFGRRFARSRRSVEDWEQGRRTPDKLCQRMMDAAAVQIALDSDYGAAV